MLFAYMEDLNILPRVYISYIIIIMIIVIYYPILIDKWLSINLQSCLLIWKTEISSHVFYTNN